MKFTKTKKIKSMKRHFVLLIFIFLSQLACASNQKIYQREAEAFCNLHHPDQWKSRTGFTALENFEYLNKRIKNSIKSKAFLAIFDKLTKQGYDNFYDAIKPEISKLTGEEWHCDAAKAFYAVKWEKIDTVNNKNQIIITVLGNGEFQIKQSRYKLFEIQKIRREIKSESRKILLKVPQNTTKKMLNQYLEPLREIGIKNLTIMYY